jgi:NAD(P)-dependent dehydrogenase (short-subunit alcohol dehydrogenase family)
MARIFITGSADGLGQMAARTLIAQGHEVVLHARNEKRAQDALATVSGAEGVLIADLSSMADTKKLASDVNAMGSFDAIIHNAGVYQVSDLELSVDGLPLILAVNTIAPYILTCLIHKPERLVYLSSGMHLQGDPTLSGLRSNKPRVTYSDSKLHVLLLSNAVARKWVDVLSNSVDPGWVPTKMGGKGAPGNLQKGAQTQVWLATSNDEKALVSGRYFHHQQETNYLSTGDDPNVQERFLALCEQISGVSFP